MEDYWTHKDTNISQIDGIGLWKSFTRNFATPLLAAFDLLDNAFDAAPLNNGHIHIGADKDENNKVRGVYMLNNSEKPVKSIRDVLTVFKSSKGTHLDAIGENGVGVKQGCATLSDLSFVLSRNKLDFSLGVVAFALQKSAGIYLPSFTFSWDPEKESKEECFEYEIKKICRENLDVADVIKTFGSGDLEAGVNGLITHFVRMTTGLWGGMGINYVFGLVLHHLKHGSADEENLDENEAIDPMQRDDLKIKQRSKMASKRTKRFMEDLAEGLPRHYLHVSNDFDVRVNGKKIFFCYWQRRLVEMTRFEVLIDKKQGVDNSNISSYARGEMNHQDIHVLQVYLGFDAIRCSGKESKTARLIYHSRRSGRLIKRDSDARVELKLTAGGTTYCQGLTIIVDDKHGAFPLNPTKQDFAFSEQSHGETHLNNLRLWLGGVVKEYYNYHLTKHCDGKKHLLTDQVKSFERNARKMLKEEGIKSIEECTFTTFGNLQWSLRQTTAGHTVYARSKAFDVKRGKDTMMQFSRSAAVDSDNDDNFTPSVSTKARKTPTKSAIKIVPGKMIAKTPKTTAKKKRKLSTGNTAEARFAVVKADDSYSPVKSLEGDLARMRKERDFLDRQNRSLHAKLEEATELEAEFGGVDLRREVKKLSEENTKLKSDLTKAQKEAKAGNSANGDAPDVESLKDEVKRLKGQMNFYMTRSDRLAEENENLLAMLEKME